MDLNDSNVVTGETLYGCGSWWVVLPGPSSQLQRELPCMADEFDSCLSPRLFERHASGEIEAVICS